MITQVKAAKWHIIQEEVRKVKFRIVLIRFSTQNFSGINSIGARRNPPLTNNFVSGGQVRAIFLLINQSK
mgnify:CR=1